MKIYTYLRSKRTHPVLCFLASMLLLVPFSKAANYSLNLTNALGNQNWDSAPWSPAGIPGSGDSVIGLSSTGNVKLLGLNGDRSLVHFNRITGGVIRISNGDYENLNAGGPNTLTIGGTLTISAGVTNFYSTQVANNHLLNVDTASLVVDGGELLLGLGSSQGVNRFHVAGTTTIAEGAIVANLSRGFSDNAIHLGHVTNHGTLRLASLNAFASSGTTQVAVNVSSLSGDDNGVVTVNAVNPGTALLKIEGTNSGMASYHGEIQNESGQIRVVKEGSGLQAFRHTSGNSYAGGTEVAGGVLIGENVTGSAFGSGSVVVRSGAELAARYRMRVELGDGGTITVEDGGALNAGLGGTAAVAITTLSGASNGTAAILDMQMGSEFTFRLNSLTNDADRIDFVDYGVGDLILNGNQVNVTGLSGPGLWTLFTFDTDVSSESWWGNEGLSLGSGFEGYEDLASFIYGTNTISVQVIPEPAAYISIFVTALGILGWRYQRRGKRAIHAVREYGSILGRVTVWMTICLVSFFFSLPEQLDGANHESLGGSARGALEINQVGHVVWRHRTNVLDRGESVPVLSVAFADGRRASFAIKERRNENGIIVLEGTLQSPELDVPARIDYQPLSSANKMQVRVHVSSFEGVQSGITELVWNWPLGLEPRKRVWFMGEYGMEWDERYFYQYIMGPRGEILPNPDRNEWRFFGLDYYAKNGFRLWKAESESTSPLTIQEGNYAPPVVQIYDRHGGVGIEASDFTGSLRVDAAEGGVARVYFHSPASFPVSAEQRDFPAKKYEFTLTVYDSEEMVLQDRVRFRESYRPHDRPEVREVMQEPEWLRTTPLTGVQYVTGGYPFKYGELVDIRKVHVAVNNQPVAVQAKPLAYWPDGSIKWALLTFPVDTGNANESFKGSRVSLRTGQSVSVDVEIQDSPSFNTNNALLVTEQNEGVVIRDGQFEMELGKGASWLRRMDYEGVALLNHKNPGSHAYTDYLINPDNVGHFEREAKGGVLDQGALVIESLVVEEKGPLRAVVRMEGMTKNQEPTRIILRLEFNAGTNRVKISHTAVFRFKDPRTTYLQAMGIQIPFRKIDRIQIEKGVVGGEGTKDRVSVIQDTVTSSTVMEEDEKGMRIAETGGALQGWTEVEQDGIVVTAAIRNFWQQAPNGLSVDFRKNTLNLEFWPSLSPVMDVRRYSNWPHRAQGESVTPKDDWVESVYYPKDPFVGVSRTHEVLLHVRGKGEHGDREAIVADFQSPPLLYAGWERYADTKVVLPVPEKQDWERAWDAWTRLTNFWLWHQSLYRWHGFWNYGDFRHQYRSGYGRILEPDVLVNALKGIVKPDRNEGIQDYFPANDWSYDNGRWGWSNTEGLPNLFLQNEYLRNGNRAVYFAAEAMARHSRDVVTRQEGVWLGRGTRHGVQHWSDGNHEERQTTITEYRIHYFLSGEGRTLDVIDHLYRKVYSKRPVRVNAWHSGRLGGLLFHWEITGNQKEAEQFRKYVHLFTSPTGLYTEPDVKFPGPVAAGEPDALNDGQMFFHTFGAMHALLEYHQITGDPVLRDSLIRMADAMMSNPEVSRRAAEGTTGMLDVFWPSVSFAAIHAPDPATYQEFMKNHIRGGAWRLMYQTVTEDPKHWSGPSGMLYRNVPRSFFWNNWAPYVAVSLGSSQLWDQEMELRYREIEENREPVPPSRTRWQSEYDEAPELYDYLSNQWPWKKSIYKDSLQN